MEIEMTDQQTSTPKSATPKSPIDAIVKAFGNIQDKLEIPEAARDFVKRSAATAKERTTELHAGANSMTGAIESAVVNAVGSVADINRKLIEAAHQDAEAALAAIEKLAGATSLAEAYQLHMDYLRERSEVGTARAKNLAELVSGKVAAGVKTMQDRFSKVAPTAA
jgi:phasin